MIPYASASKATSAPGASPAIRWTAPLVLVAVEYLALSLLADLPDSGPAMRLAATVRMLVPAVIGGGAAGWLIARRSDRTAREDASVPARPWRPWPALVLHLAAFTATAVAAHRLFGAGEVGAAAFVLWLGGAAATVLLAVFVAAPPSEVLAAASRHLRVPLLATCAGLLSWRAVAAAEGLWGFLQSGTLHAVAALLRVVAGDVVVDPAESLVGASGFEVLVAPVCSGVDGLGLVVVFQAVWLSFARARVQLGRALVLLVPLGAAAALGANVLRITSLILLGAHFGEDLAMGAFHSKLGWLLFLAIALASVALVEHVPWVRRRDERGPAADEGVPRAAGAYLTPLVAALVVALATSLWADAGFDRAYALRAVAAVAALLLVRRSLPSPSLALSWPALLLGAGTGLAWMTWAGGDASAMPAALAALAPAERAAWIATRLLGSVLVLPVVEELAFRGFLLPWLVDPDFERVPPRAWTWPAVLLSSLAFGAVHEEWLLGALAGAAFAAARAWRGRLGDAIVAHVLANAIVAAAVLAGGRWTLWR